MLACGLEGAAAAVAYFDPSSAVRIFGAAEALRDELGVPITPADFKLVERPLAQARDRLGEAEFDAGWSAGRNLSPDEAVAEVIAHADTPPTMLSESRPAPLVLSRREREVTELLAQGQTNAQIAVALGIARPTVDKHVSNILGKLGFSSRSEIRAWASEHGLLPSDDSSPS